MAAMEHEVEARVEAAYGPQVNTILDEHEHRTGRSEMTHMELLEAIAETGMSVVVVKDGRRRSSAPTPRAARRRPAKREWKSFV